MRSNSKRLLLLDILARLYEAVFIRDDLNLSQMLESVLLMMLSLPRSVFFLFVPKKGSEIGPSTLFTRLVLCKFWLFPKLNTTLKGHRLLDAVKIQGHVATILKVFTGQGFQQCFEH
jgi:hypothetical protein